MEGKDRWELLMPQLRFMNWCGQRVQAGLGKCSAALDTLNWMAVNSTIFPRSLIMLQNQYIYSMDLGMGTNCAGCLCSLFGGTSRRDCKGCCKKGGLVRKLLDASRMPACRILYPEFEWAIGIGAGRSWPRPIQLPGRIFCRGGISSVITARGSAKS